VTTSRARLVAALDALADAIDAHAAEEARDPLATPIDAAIDAPADLEAVVDSFARGHVATRHPRYFGPPHPAPSRDAIVARALAAIFNPQLATRAHAPWPVDLEASLLADLGRRYGHDADAIDGVFTQGGAESNLTALALAANERLEGFADGGARALDASPAIYASTEAHATIARAVRVMGLGRRALVAVPVDAAGRMKVDALRAAIRRDRAAGARPFAIVATVGTTSEGAVDPVAPIADVAARERCWLHVDAAWGGLLAFVAETRSAIDGVARADSIAFDLHKAMPIAIGVGALLTRHRGALHAAFAETSGYMPHDSSRDPYARGLPWSRRFAGLELHMLVARDGGARLAEAFVRQRALADRLRARLTERGWRIVNDTPLPVVCFVDASATLAAIARDVVARGEAWISVVRGANGRRSLRACIGSATTTEADVDALVAALDDARSRHRR
jgi:glutamate/tyrosine decarboxylase-like PLP-dependent enzyme